MNPRYFYIGEKSTILCMTISSTFTVDTFVMKDSFIPVRIHMKLVFHSVGYTVHVILMSERQPQPHFTDHM